MKTALGWPVFPSGTRMKIYFLARGGVGVCRDRPLVARVVELVDTQVSEACAVRCSGSSPLPGTSRGKSALKWLEIAQSGAVRQVLSATMVPLMLAMLCHARACDRG